MRNFTRGKSSDYFLAVGIPATCYMLSMPIITGRSSELVLKLMCYLNKSVSFFTHFLLKSNRFRQ